jgi:hypothetical protein
MALLRGRLRAAMCAKAELDRLGLWCSALRRGAYPSGSGSEWDKIVKSVTLALPLLEISE